MAGVPYTFATATTSIPLSQLDANFNTQITLGNTTVGLGNTVTTLGNVTLTNVNIISGTVPAPTSIANGTSNVSISSSGGNINVVTGGAIATFPAATGTVMVSGNMPVFSYYQSVAQTLSSGTFTKITFTQQEFDTTAGMYASSRFTPTIAGYYQINGSVNYSGTSSEVLVAIYKNGSQWKFGSDAPLNAQSVVSSIVYLNGSTDYIEIWGYFSVGQLTSASQVRTYFNGCMLRSA